MSAPARRAHILAAALDAFAARGYRATSMDEIAQRAGVTRAVLYDHFAFKKALFLALLEDQNALFLGHVGARISGTGSAEERMRETMATVFAFAERHPQTWRLLFGNTTHGDQEVDDVAIHVRRRRVEMVGRLLAPDMRRAGIDPESPRAEIMVEMLIAALCGAADWRREHPEATEDELVEAGTDLLWRGLGQLEP
jgi:AcrR family transcriptional regulator